MDKDPSPGLPVACEALCREPLTSSHPLQVLVLNLFDDLDQALDRRGPLFARDGDAFLTVAQSQRAGERGKANRTRVLPHHLKLEMNEPKSRVGPPRRACFGAFPSTACASTGPPRRSPTFAPTCANSRGAGGVSRWPTGFGSSTSSSEAGYPTLECRHTTVHAPNSMPGCVAACAGVSGSSGAPGAPKAGSCCNGGPPRKRRSSPR
jgi:hypothetical protein